MKMASERSFSRQQQNCLRSLWGILPLVIILAIPTMVQAQAPLSSGFYAKFCPKLERIVRKALFREMKKEWRIGASLTRLMFHDCFVQGCDASVLLDDTPASLGEKQATPNNNSLRGFDAFDNIKAAVEHRCPGVVSCADILVIAARDAVVANGGPWWDVELGRRDSFGASFDLANNDLPLAIQDANTLIAKFAKQGLDQTDLVALVGSHTFGKAQCPTFRQRLYNFQGTGGPDPTMDPDYVAALRVACPEGGSDTVVVDLDQTSRTGSRSNFDNAYYSNLLINRGLLTSDQTLHVDNAGTAGVVNAYAANQNEFFKQFSWSMTKMGRISPLTGTAGQIRCNCRKVNSW